MVTPAGIEPASSESESEILSIEIRSHVTHTSSIYYASTKKKLEPASSESLPDCVSQAGESEILSIEIRSQKNRSAAQMYDNRIIL